MLEGVAEEVTNASLLAQTRSSLGGEVALAAEHRPRFQALHWHCSPKG